MQTDFRSLKNPDSATPLKGEYTQHRDSERKGAKVQLRSEQMQNGTEFEAIGSTADRIYTRRTVIQEKGRGLHSGERDNRARACQGGKHRRASGDHKCQELSSPSRAPWETTTNKHGPQLISKGQWRAQISILA